MKPETSDPGASTALVAVSSEPKRKRRKPRHGAARAARKARRRTGKTGRPPILSDKITKRIVDALKVGAFIETAVANAGIAQETYNLWMRKGHAAKRANDPYRRFMLEATQAIAAGEMNHLNLITRASKDGQWQASQFVMRARFRRRWSDQGQADGNALADILAKKAQLELERAQVALELEKAKLAAMQGDPRSGLTSEDEEVARLMRERFGEAVTYPDGKGVQ